LVSELTYPCRVCGMTCIKAKSIPANPTQWGISRGITQTGSYAEGTPPPTTFDLEVYETATISFSAETDTAPAKIADSECRLADKGFVPGEAIVISTESGTNDGTYTLAERGAISRASLALATGSTLSDEDAATAGTVTISVRTYKPNVTTGCSFCGSLNSR
jgi:hypothetical protein